MFCTLCQKYTKDSFQVCNCGTLCQNCFRDQYVIYNYEYLIFPQQCAFCGRQLSHEKREVFKNYIRRREEQRQLEEEENDEPVLEEALRRFDEWIRIMKDDQIKEALNLKYDDGRTMRKIAKRRLRKRETVVDYYNAIRKWADGRNLNDQALKDEFIRGLPQHMVHHFKHLEIDTSMMEAVRVAETLEKKIHRNQHRRRRDNN